ncbi:hypothetical protein ACFQ14_14455 [Pseudahrensia aquimaris]|uniref:Capsule polysaccharide biosynthesis protein n=1 Tax=Pseudahrensia aquimaris TaxID=744461 RepID=A0ABW3FHK8_9HYPH
MARKIQSSPFANERALFVQRNLFTDASPVHALFSHTQYLRPTDLASIKLETVKNAGFDRIVFGNPYSALDAKALYRQARDSGFPRLIIERGALPGTVFLDEDGFLADSDTYQSNAITSGPDDASSLEELQTRYLGRPALEPQKNGPVNLSSSGAFKVLFALQDSSDTAVQFQRTPSADYPAFLRTVEAFISAHSSQFEFYFKPHPREPDTRIAGAQSLARTDIINALRTCDAVVTFSSGVGILAMVLGKPVCFFGNAFYQNAPGAFPFDGTAQLKAQLTTTPQEKAKSLPFLNHLAASYSDCSFFGRRAAAPSSRDVMCRFTNVKLVHGGKRWQQSINEIWPSVAARSVRRTLENRLSLTGRSL